MKILAKIKLAIKLLAYISPNSIESCMVTLTKKPWCTKGLGVFDFSNTEIAGLNPVLVQMHVMCPISQRYPLCVQTLQWAEYPQKECQSNNTFHELLSNQLVMCLNSQQPNKFELLEKSARNPPQMRHLRRSHSSISWNITPCTLVSTCQNFVGPSCPLLYCSLWSSYSSIDVSMFRRNFYVSC